MTEEKDGMALRVRPPAFGLPTGCPRCLASYLYLRLANMAFRTVYSAKMADSDDLPILELGRRAGYSSEAGGLEEFAREQNICDLDVNMTQLEKAELQAFKSLLVPLQDALDYEIWSLENDWVAEQIYVSQLPWPVSKAIIRNMRRKAMARLGVTKENASFQKAEIYKRAFDAYANLETKKQADPFLIRETPTSLDAALLAHLLFVVTAPLQESSLRDELEKKHRQLLRYVNGFRDELLKSSPMFPEPARSPPIAPYTTTGGASSSKSSNKGETKRKQTSKEKEFKKKSKLFLIAQLAAIVGCVIFSSLDEDEEDD